MSHSTSFSNPADPVATHMPPFVNAGSVSGSSYFGGLFPELVANGNSFFGGLFPEFSAGTSNHHMPPFSNGTTQHPHMPPFVNP